MQNRLNIRYIVFIVLFITLGLSTNAWSGTGHFGHSQLSFPESFRDTLDRVYIPFEFLGRLISVQGTVEGITGNFIFDTGAECVVLNDLYFNHGLSRAEASIGNSGRVQNATERYLDTVFIDEMFTLDVRCHVFDLSHISQKKNARIHGILGYSAIEEFEIMIDYPMRLIILDRLDKEGGTIMNRPNFDRPIDSLRFDLQRHLITFDAEVNARKFLVALDTGAEVNLLDRKVGRRVLKDFEILRRVNMTGMSKGEVEVLAGVLKQVKVGQMKPKSMHTLLTNLDKVNRGFGSSIFGVIGYEFLQDKRIVINYRKKKIYFLNLQRP